MVRGKRNARHKPCASSVPPAPVPLHPLLAPTPLGDTSRPVSPSMYSIPATHGNNYTGQQQIGSQERAIFWIKVMTRKKGVHLMLILHSPLSAVPACTSTPAASEMLQPAMEHGAGVSTGSTLLQGTHSPLFNHFTILHALAEAPVRMLVAS